MFGLGERCTKRAGTAARQSIAGPFEEDSFEVLADQGFGEKKEGRLTAWWQGGEGVAGSSLFTELL